jgi:predicted lipoprotein with Yx(FWY)xxD motif
VVKRILISLVAVAALAPAGLALAAPRGPAVVKVSKSSLGKILVNGAGRTLYMFTRDGRNKDRCVSISGCTAVWPPLLTKGKPLAKSGASSKLLGTIKLSHGRVQVTYAGHPLYTYVGDFGPHQTSYVGVFQSGGRWFALNSAGKVVK